jgi:hypothetical protein
MTLLVVAVADVLISWKCSVLVAPAEWVLAAAIPAPPSAAVAAAAAIVAVMVLRMTRFPPEVRTAGWSPWLRRAGQRMSFPTMPETAQVHILSNA